MRVARVTFNSEELHRAGEVALRRHIAALSLPDKHAQRGKSWFIGLTKHILGALGELAVARALNIAWAGPVNTFKRGGDVGAWQVRTRSKQFHELIVRDDDRDEDLFWLVRLAQQHPTPVMEVVGSILGRDAKRPEWRKDHGGHGAAYFPPDSALKRVDADDYQLRGGDSHG